jgi:RNA polymerase-binding transcription factor DksA
MSAALDRELRLQLEQRKQELAARLERITANLIRGLDPNSKEQAQQLEDAEVVDALGNEARTEVAKITAALARMDSGRFGICTQCSEPIEVERKKAYPCGSKCIECARDDERRSNYVKTAVF